FAMAGRPDSPSTAGTRAVFMVAACAGALSGCATPTVLPDGSPSQTISFAGGSTTGADPDSVSPDPGSLQVFPSDNPWNQDISNLPVHPNSENYLASIGLNSGLHPDFGTVWEGAPIGIPYVVVAGGQPGVPVSFYYDTESDHGLYPIPPDVAIEGGTDSTGDRHVIVIDAGQQKLYELYDAHPHDSGSTAG